MWRSEPEMDNKPYWEKDDFAGLDMSSVWTTTSTYHSKHWVTLTFDLAFRSANERNLKLNAEVWT